MIIYTTAPKDHETLQHTDLDDRHAGNKHLHDALNAQHSVVWTYTTAEALKELINPALSFDLIICGVHLENESMFDFLKLVKNDPRNKRIPFVCFRVGTSIFAKTSDPQIERTCRFLGVSDYIALSGLTNDPESLRSKIEASIGSVRAKRRRSKGVQH